MSSDLPTFKSKARHRHRDSQIILTLANAYASLAPLNEQGLVESQTSVALPDFDYCTRHVRGVIDKIYEMKEITDIVISTILAANYDDTDDILDDIDTKPECLLIKKISQQIEQSDTIAYEWNDEDKHNLKQILTMVYKDHIIDLHRYERKVFQIDPFIRKVILIAKELNKTMRKQIPITNLRELLHKEQMNQASIGTINHEEMEQIAIKYGIKPHHAQRILNKIRAQSEEMEAEFTDRSDISDFDLGGYIEKSQSLKTNPLSEDALSLDALSGEEDEAVPDLYRNFSMPLNSDTIHVNSPPLDVEQYKDKAKVRFDISMVSKLKPGLTRTRSKSISMQRKHWTVGSTVQAYSRAQQNWIRALIIKVFTHNDTEWLLLKCADNALVEIRRTDDHIRPMTIPSPSIHKREQSANIAAMFDKITMESLLHKLRRVLDAINHDIDSHQSFLYQIYHVANAIMDDDDIRKFGTYENEKAMEKYSEMYGQKYPTVMLCNGSIMGSYGDRDRCFKCEMEAKQDYNNIQPYVHHVLLNTTDILHLWNLEQYDQKRLLSMQREDIIGTLTKSDSFQIPTIQTAVKLYDKLKKALKSDQLPDESDKLEDIAADIAHDIAHDKYRDIMFLWTKKHPITDGNELDITSLDAIHFLYIVSLVLDDLKTTYDKVDTSRILRCLSNIKMNGLMFDNIEQIVFERSIIMYSHSTTEIELEPFRQLMKCATDLWVQIRGFDLSQIQPSSICNVSFCNEQKEDEEQKDDEEANGDEKVEDKREPDDVPIFEQWMTTFNSKYNRNTPFSFDVFTDLMKVYTEDKSAIIKIKYDNYATDLNEKTYDHVLKSFITWAITLKCGNLRCNEKPKLQCFCDTDRFQSYTYDIIIQLIALKANHDYGLLKILCDTKQSVTAIAKAFCNILSDALHEKNYFKSYKVLVSDWINFEFYNFVCNYCHHINKSIMIDRIYEYSKSLDSCRVCNKRQISRITNNRPQFDINDAVDKKNSVITELYEQHSEFTVHLLNEYLTKCGVPGDALCELNRFLHSQGYDSDGVIADINDGEKLSNIQRCIIESAQTSGCNNYYHLVHKFLNYHQFPTYQNGKLIRYLVLRPKFFSLVKEICLNGIYPLSIRDWTDRILVEVIKEYKKKTLRSKVTDNRFGIEEGEPIGINHLISIFLFTEGADRFQKYRRFFCKSFYLWHKAVHCNNFYWIGRYLYEAVQFYGKEFAHNREGSKLYQGLHTIKSFDCIAPTFNSPILTTDDLQTARRYATNKGCTLSLAPKYYGHIDNSKFLDTKLFNKVIRLLKGTKVQLRSIQIITPAKRLDNIVLAMQYIEKILTQTEFDAHFYNTNGLYTPQNTKAAYVLIMEAVIRNNNTHIPGDILVKSKCTDLEDKTKPYVHHLFDNWCFKRDFVTFETFRFEMHFMNFKLKRFLFDDEMNKVNIVNVKKFLPNLKHYHDINGVLRNVNIESKQMHIPRTEDDTVHESFGLLYNCQEHHIPHHIVSALQDMHYNFEKCKGVLREALRMRLSKLDINSASFYSHSTEFNTELVSIGIEENVGATCIENIKNIHVQYIHQRAETNTLITYILDELQKQKWNGVKCDTFILKIAFKHLYSDDLKILKKPIMKRHKVTAKDLYSVAKNIEIFDRDTAMRLSKYLYIKMMDDKEKVRPWICSFCEFLNCTLMVDGLWRYYNEANKCGLCGEPRSEITNESKTHDTAASPRVHRRYACLPTIRRQQSMAPNIPKIDTEEWEDVDDSQCTLFKSVKHLSNNQLLYLLDHYFMEQITKKKLKEKLVEHKHKICEYFSVNKLNGRRFVERNKRKFTKDVKGYCKDNKLLGALTQLHKVMTECDLTKIHDIPQIDDNERKGDDEEYQDIVSDCPAIQRVEIVLKHFQTLTNQLSQANNAYEHNIQWFLSLFPAYSAVSFLNDIDHIIRHKLKHRQKCEYGSSCIHMQRATRDRNANNCKTLSLKKQFFNTNNASDFVYISMLDRAHCLLNHSEDIGMKMTKNIEKLHGDAIKIRHMRYNTGVYMEYHTLKPLYQNLYDEIVGNQKCEITEDQFNSELETSKLFLKTDNTMNEWRACRTDEKYGIKVNEPMHIEHVLCIKFYCNYSKHCEQFRKSYRRVRVEDTKDDIIRRHCHNHYWFGRFLTAAIVFWGKIPKKTDNFYHGLSGKFVFDHFSAVYEIPTSTTWDINVAHGFSESAAGIVLELSPKYTDEVNNSRCLDVSGLSEFQSEREKLFAGMTVLSITNIYNPSDNNWDGYGDYVAAFLYFERIIEQTNQQKDHYNYGKISKYQQNHYLVPLIEHQMNKSKDTHNKDYDCYDDNKDDDDKKEEQTETPPTYVCVLFEHFCDNKRDYIDLSCINEEIPLMTPSLQTILFQDIQFAEANNEIVREYKINNCNIQRIFPNLVEYKNHMSNWIYVAKDVLLC